MRTLKQIEAAEKRLAKKQTRINIRWKKFLDERDKVIEERIRLKIAREGLKVGI